MLILLLHTHRFTHTHMNTGMQSDCFLTACRGWVCTWTHHSCQLLGHCSGANPLPELTVFTYSILPPYVKSEATTLTAHVLNCKKTTNIWAAASSLWLTSCVPFSLTLPLPVFLRARILTRCKVCELLPFVSFDIWWFDEFQRDSGRVYGTAESGISSASFKVLHLTMDLSPVFICPTPFPLPPLPCFSSLIYTDLHTFSTLSFLHCWNIFFSKYGDEHQDWEYTLKGRAQWLPGC